MEIEEEPTCKRGKLSSKLNSIDDDSKPVAMEEMMEVRIIAQEECFQPALEVAGAKVLEDYLTDDQQSCEIYLDRHRKDEVFNCVPSSHKCCDIHTNSDSYLSSFYPQKTLSYFRGLVSRNEWKQNSELIGTGATAQCYKFGCKLTNIQVVAKKFTTNTKSSSMMEQQLSEEARMLQRINGHRNFLSFIGVEKIGGDCWILTRYESGGTVESEIEKMRQLSLQIERNARLPPGKRKDRLRQLKSMRTEMTLLLAPQLFEGLAFLHKSGIVHLDIKTENLLLDCMKQRLIIADFGSAKEVDSNGALNIGMSMIGTAGFLAPEMVHHEAECGTPCDMYSAGVCLYIMIIDPHPYNGLSYRKKDAEVRLIFAGGRAQDIMPPAHIPEPLHHIIRSCLRRDPQGRISAAEAFDHFC